MMIEFNISAVILLRQGGWIDIGDDRVVNIKIRFIKLSHLQNTDVFNIPAGRCHKPGCEAFTVIATLTGNDGDVHFVERIILFVDRSVKNIVSFRQIGFIQMHTGLIFIEQSE